jgi:hypothetical protein
VGVKISTRQKKTIILLLCFLLPSFSLFAQSNSGGRRGDDLTLKIAVIGPGDELYFWWGHIGIVIEDRVTGQSRFYDWGVFSFDNENFFVNFAFGRLLYSCTVSRAEQNYNTYIRTNRDITLYTLDLPADKKEAVLRFAEINMLPENRDYAYHHFRDNCATRIRDILDMALDGRFKAEYGQASGRYTFRQHVRCHTWFNPFIDWILNFWMGQDIDKPITVWDEMFLPSEIALRISDFSHPGGKPLVSAIETINRSRGRPAVLEIPPRQWPRALFTSFLLSAIIAFFYFFLQKRKGAVVFLGIANALLGLFFGIAGSMLFFLSLFTDHDYTYHNSNLFFVNPLFLAAIPLGLFLAFSKSGKKRLVSNRLLMILWAYVFLGGVFSIAIKLSPVFSQQNQVTQALLLPLALTMVFIISFPNLLAQRRQNAKVLPRLICLFTMIFFASALEAQEMAEETPVAAGIFPLALILEEARYASYDPNALRPVWRPDWPVELPPDAFRVVSGEISRAEIETEEYSLSMSYSPEGLVEEFPFMLNDKMTQAGIVYGESAEIRKMVLTFPSGEEPWELEFLGNFSFHEDYFPFIVRGFCSGVWYFIYLSRGVNEIIETWYDENGSILGAFKFSLTLIGKDLRIRAIFDYTITEETEYHYDSRGFLTEASGPGGLYKVLYYREDLPRYWERRPAEDEMGGGNFTLQWDEAEFLLRISGGDNPVDYRYEYTLDERGNWIERRETRMIQGFGLLVPSQGTVFMRKLEYRE